MNTLLINEYVTNIREVIDANQLTVTKHAKDRIKERLNIPHKQAERWAQSKAVDAKYVSVATDDRGNDVRMFAAE